jgi:hypothetical protein
MSVVVFFFLPLSSWVGAGRPCALRSRGFNRRLITNNQLPTANCQPLKRIESFCFFLETNPSMSFPPLIAASAIEGLLAGYLIVIYLSAASLHTA